MCLAPDNLLRLPAPCRLQVVLRAPWPATFAHTVLCGTQLYSCASVSASVVCFAKLDQFTTLTVRHFFLAVPPCVIPPVSASGSLTHVLLYRCVCRVWLSGIQGTWLTGLALLRTFAAAGILCCGCASVQPLVRERSGVCSSFTVASVRLMARCCCSDIS
jgi:hypothetical protein